MFRALTDAGLLAEPAVYHDDFSEEVRPQFMAADAVLVWMNPIQDGRNRSILDPLLRNVAADGVFVSTHPDIEKSTITAQTTPVAIKASFSSPHFKGRPVAIEVRA